MDEANHEQGQEFDPATVERQLRQLGEAIASARVRLAGAEAAAKAVAPPAAGRPRLPNYDRYMMGGDCLAAGLVGGDVEALAALLARGPDGVASLILAAADGKEHTYVLRLFRPILDDIHAADQEGHSPSRKTRDARRRRRRLDDADKLALGCVFYDLGFRADHASALMGLWSLGVSALLQRIDVAAAAAPGAAFGACLLAAVQADEQALAARGARSRFRRDEHRYFERRQTWELASEDVHAGAWRERPATRRQGQLMITTARALMIPPPQRLTRGAAADWLEEHGANLRFRKRS